MSKSNEIAVAVAFIAGLKRVLEDVNSETVRPGGEIVLRAFAQASGSYFIAELLDEVEHPAARAGVATALAGLSHLGAQASQPDDLGYLVADTLRVASGSVALLSTVEVAANAIQELLQPEPVPAIPLQSPPLLARPPRVFVSHSWAESDDFFALRERVKAETMYLDHSVHIGKALDYVSDPELERKLADHIRGVDVVLVLAHAKALEGQWVKREVDIALEMGKPIVAVRPHGHRNRPLHPWLRNSAIDQVGWNAPAVARRIQNWSEFLRMSRDAEHD